MFIRKWLVGLVGLALLFGGPVRAGIITFTSDRDGNYNIYLMNADGSNQTRLTDSAAMDVNSVFSPDGQRIAFLSDRTGTFQIYTMNRDGTGLQGVANSQASDYWGSGIGSVLAWSPDGQKLLFKPTDDSSLATINLDGSNRTVLFTGGVGVHSWVNGVEWGPSGNDVFFGASVAGGGWDQHIFRYAISTGTTTQITPDGFVGQGPKVSPNGSLIAYHHSAGGLPIKNIYTMNLDGTGDHQLTFDTGSVENQAPTWVATTSDIIYDSNRSGSRQIWIMDSAGGNQRMLTTEGNNTLPSWSSVPELNAVPEPSALVMFAGLGAIGLVSAWRKRNRAA